MKRRNLILSVLLVAALAYCANQQYAEQQARADADAVAARLQERKAATGAYPASLAEIGFDAQALKDKWRLSYRLENGKPFLFYSAQNNWLVAWHYDFTSRSWRSQD
ncbi:hypothetical protein [Ramlibacter albus]|uniref:Lipoprotein n=1 Tax=Ramlibacter albus TaxID=2079448 RepID=A0A923S2Y8_9BURK|nr:hypothetical protein [Ramlibacter albus]MBC5765846.1 hypothetical protein [Ramlibacter albus]